MKKKERKKERKCQGLHPYARLTPPLPSFLFCHVTTHQSLTEPQDPHRTILLEDPSSSEIIQLLLPAPPYCQVFQNFKQLKRKAAECLCSVYQHQCGILSAAGALSIRPLSIYKLTNFHVDCKAGNVYTCHSYSWPRCFVADSSSDDGALTPLASYCLMCN